MAIFFSCQCGQPLRADENGSAGHTRCLACGRLTRIPSLQRANQLLGIQGDGPALDAAEGIVETPIDLSPPEAPPPTLKIPPIPVSTVLLVEEAQVTPVRPAPKRSRRADSEDDDQRYRLAPERDDDPADELRSRIDRQKVRSLLKEAQKELSRRKRFEPTWDLETHWYECLLYPLRLALQVALLSGAWATATAIVVAFVPEIGSTMQLSVYVPMLPFYFFLLGYTVGLLQITLTSALKGQTSVAFPARDLLRIATGGMQALVCFLVGPILPLVAAYFFWLDSGDLETPDWLILIELGMASTLSWTLALLAVTWSGSVLDAHPVAVVNLIQRRGLRVLAIALLIAAVLVGHTLWMFGAVEDLHRGPFGWLELVAIWSALLYWLLFLLRWMGINLSRLRAQR